MSYQVTAKYGTIVGTSGVAQPFFFDVNSWEKANFDVTIVLSAAGVTEKVARSFTVTVTQYSATQLSTGLVTPLQTSAYVVASG